MIGGVQMGLEQHPLVDAIGEGRKAVSAARGKPLSASSRDSVSPPDDKSPPNGGGGGAGGLPRGPITYVTLSGFIGDGDDPGWFRLYIDETLNAWLAIRRIDVVNQERRQVEGMPAAGVDVVWLAHDAQISLARRQPLLDPKEARYLEGDFMVASDFSGSDWLDTGGRARSRGVFCDGTSVGCCRNSSKISMGSGKP